MVYYFWYAITHGIRGIIQYYKSYITTRYIICGQPIYQRAFLNQTFYSIHKPKMISKS